MPRGQKTCPKCGVNLGPRTLVCSQCKHDFFAQEEKTTPVVKVQEKVVEPKRSNLLRVYTPAGKCPIPFGTLEIDDWKNAVNEIGAQRGVFFTDDAFEYWLRYSA